MKDIFMLGAWLLCGPVYDDTLKEHTHIFPVLADYTERQCKREAKKRPGFWCVKREPGTGFADNCLKDF